VAAPTNTRQVAGETAMVAGSTSRRFSMADITKSGNGLPNRYVIHGVEGIGKTSLPAYAPSPIFIETRGETGLETLIDANRLPALPHFPAVETWMELLGIIQMLTDDPHDYRTLVIDTLNGAEKLCHEEVCRRDFKNDWTDSGFMGYMRGFEVACADWLDLIQRLDALRERRKMAIVCLCHTCVKPFKNPEGPDYDRWQPDMHHKTWGLTNKWSDAILFMNYETFTSKDDKKKCKATGGQTRIMYTERCAAYDAKNRMGLPSDIVLGNSGQEAWNAFSSALKTAKQTNQPTSNGKEGV